MGIVWRVVVGVFVVWGVLTVIVGVLFEIVARREGKRRERQLPQKKVPQHIVPPVPLEIHVRRVPMTASDWNAAIDKLESDLEQLEDLAWVSMTLKDIQTLPEAKRQP